VYPKIRFYILPSKKKKKVIYCMKRSQKQFAEPTSKDFQILKGYLVYTLKNICFIV